MSIAHPSIRLHPSSRQFIVEQGFTVVCTAAIVMAVACGLVHPKMIPYIIGVEVCIILYLFYRYLYLKTMVFVITEEQLKYQYGIFSSQRDFIELYRVVDYSEQRSFFQILLGIKTVSIYSGDRTHPRLDIIGVDNKQDLITTLRERVELNKKRHNIHEFTNTH